MTDLEADRRLNDSVGSYEGAAGLRAGEVLHALDVTGVLAAPWHVPLVCVCVCVCVCGVCMCM